MESNEKLPDRSVGLGSLTLVVAVVVFVEFFYGSLPFRMLFFGMMNLAMGAAFVIGRSAPRVVRALGWTGLACALGYFTAWLAD